MASNDTSRMDLIEVGNEFYIRAQSSLADPRTLVLLHKDTFAILDRYGDIQPIGVGKQGLFFEESRHLSRLELSINGQRPLLLSSTTRHDNVLVAVDLTNPDLEISSGKLLHGGVLHFGREILVADGMCFQNISAHNFGQEAVDFELSFLFAGDFADIFEVRGQKRSRRGIMLPEEITGAGITLSYEGLDHVVRSTRIESSMPHCRVSSGEISGTLHLEPREELSFSLNAVCYQNGNGSARRPNYHEALLKVTNERHFSSMASFEIETSNAQFNEWISRSRSDLEMMLAPTPYGVYPYAGIPWFSTIFGRDGLITAFELLWLVPEVARGVLSYLAATQARARDPERDAEPGKILHEMRKGEMARLREVPFDRYYGTVDATPLFVLLAAAYDERTGDTDFLKGIWPNIEAALEWIDHCGDIDGDGFVEYARASESGLVQQGWKDSYDSMFHADGALAQGPIALCEVQSYVYAAKSRIASTAEHLGMSAAASKLRAEAAKLRKKFDQAFWCDDLSTFAMALDGNKQPCKVRSSNAGHCLFSGIASPSQCIRTMESLASADLFSGWGVRTVAAGQSRYNPMSYHNGSVWPHDNAMIAFGAAGSKDKSLALKILSGLLNLSALVELHRLPELICGFYRRPGKGPTLYPVACSPQAWSTGSVFLVLQACLGLSIQARAGRVSFHYPALPEELESVEIRNLNVGTASVDLRFTRAEETVSVDLLRRSGDLEIVCFQ